MTASPSSTPAAWSSSTDCRARSFSSTPGASSGSTRPSATPSSKVSTLKSGLLGGEGLFLATLEGAGRVWLQSIPVARLADEMARSSPWLKSELDQAKRSDSSG